MLAGELGTSVARRIFLLVVGLVVGPVVLTAGFGYWSVSKQITSAADDLLRTAAKDYAMAVLDRTRSGQRTLLTLAANRDAPAEFPAEIANSVVVSTLTDGATIGPRQSASFSLDATSGSIRFDIPTPKPDSRHLVGTFSPAFLWGAGDDLAAGVSTCIASSSGQIFRCQDQTLQLALAAQFRPGRGERAGTQIFESSGGKLRAAWWAVPPSAGLGGAAFISVAVQPEQIALAPLTSFREFVPPTVALAIVVSAWIALALIRRRMRPLDQLVKAAERLSVGDFKTPVQLAADDELATVGTAFDAMRNRLGRQFRELEALAAIDTGVLRGDDRQSIAELAFRELAPLIPEARVSIRFGDSPADAVTGNAGLEAQTPAAAVPFLDGAAAAGAIVLEPVGGMTVSSESRRTAAAFADRLSVAFGNARQRDQLYRIAHYDPLTGLPNRTLIEKLLQRRIVDDPSTPFYVAYVDLDGFKRINDAEGHTAGDSLLAEAAKRIQQCLEPADCLGRFGGDEFVALILSDADHAQVVARTARILAAIREPFRVTSFEYFVGASIGVARYPRDCAGAPGLVEAADMAMYVAKTGGGNRAEFYRPALRAQAEQRNADESELRRALADGDITVHFQPQFALDGMPRIVGAEALVRWRRITGYFPPEKLIELAERTGLISPLGMRVLEEACSTFMTWCEFGYPVERIAVNVSGKQLQDPDFPAQLRAVLARTGMPPCHLEIEITESVLVADAALITRVLGPLRDSGIRIAIDDFGTGYSSLSYLRTIPFDTLKLDQSFMRDLGHDTGAGDLVIAVIRLGQQLGKTVAIEGVETTDQLAFVRTANADLVQGFLLGEPVSGSEFVGRFVAHRPADAAVPLTTS